MDTHVVVVGRAGDHDGSELYLVGSDNKREVYKVCEAQFRANNNLISSIMLHSKIIFSGPRHQAEMVMARVVEKASE